MKKLLFLFLLLPCFANATVYYMAPDGINSNPGTYLQPWKSFAAAQAHMISFDALYVRGGTYTFVPGDYIADGTYNLIKNKSNIYIQNYPGETPVFDFESIGAPTQCDPVALYIINCTNLTVKGLIIKNLFQNTAGCGVSRGVTVSGGVNVRLEQMEVFNIGGSGFKIEDGSVGTYFKNCDAHNVGDPLTDGGADAWDNSDGFSCTGGDLSTNTTFDGCRTWLCADDGWDFFGTNGVNYLNNCWSFWNGYKPWGISNTQVTPSQMTNTSNPAVFLGNLSYMTGIAGEGFKLGPAASQNFSLLTKTVTNCVSFQNNGAGYASNSLSSLTTKHVFYNNIAYDNGNDGFSYGAGWSVGATQTFKNNWAYHNNLQEPGFNFIYDGNYSGATLAYNGWDAQTKGNLPITINNSDFLSTSSIGVDGPRSADGSLPVLTFLHLAPGSDMIGVGTELGYGTDLGAFQTGAPSVATANAGTDKAIILPTSTVSLTGSGTGTAPLAYLWQNVSGPNTAVITNGTTTSPTISGLIEGVYLIRLRVTDAAASVAYDTMQINVQESSTITPVGVIMRQVTLNAKKQAVIKWASTKKDPKTSFEILRKLFWGWVPVTGTLVKDAVTDYSYAVGAAKGWNYYKVAIYTPGLPNSYSKEVSIKKK